MTTALQEAPKPGKNEIRTLIQSDHFKEQVALALPKHMTPDRFARVALTALTRVPKLMDCTRESLLRCLMDCSQLGLEPDGRHAHLIPYGKECTMIIDYKGLIALARRSGDVAVWRAELLKESDTFNWINSTVHHEINWRKDRGKTEAVYSYVKFKDGSEDWEVMTLTEVQAVKARSRAGNSGPWVTDFDEMAKKTVIRRHSKRLTLSPEFCDALEKDGDRLEERPIREAKAAKVPHGLFGAEKALPETTEQEQPPTARDAVERKVEAGNWEMDVVFQAIRALGFCGEGCRSVDDMTPGEWATAESKWKEILTELEAR